MQSSGSQPNQPPYQPPPYYATTGYTAPAPLSPEPAAPRRRVRWIIIPLIVLLALVGLGFLGVRLFTGLKQGIDEVQGATTAYFDAVKAHDWNAAHDMLDADLAAKTTPADLQATWTRREQADGPINRFASGNTRINSANGRVTGEVAGTLSYQSGTSDPKIVTLVQEGGKWKLSSLP